MGHREWPTKAKQAIAEIDRVATVIEGLAIEGQEEPAQSNPHMLQQILAEIKAEARQVRIVIMQVDNTERRR